MKNCCCRIDGRGTRTEEGGRGDRSPISIKYMPSTTAETNDMENLNVLYSNSFRSSGQRPASTSHGHSHGSSVGIAVAIFPPSSSPPLFVSTFRRNDTVICLYTPDSVRDGAEPGTKGGSVLLASTKSRRARADNWPRTN